MCRKIPNAIQFRAKTELKPIPSIYNAEISKLHGMPRPGKELLNYQLLTLKIRHCTEHAKKKLEGKFRLTTSQEQFLQTDDGDIDKILLFSTTEYLLHLCAAETIYCDGTSYTALPMFNRIIYLFKYHYPRICW
jgi:hypothetical protein